MKNRQKIDANFDLEKKRPKIAQKSVLGGSWASFGKGLGRSWASSGRSWPPLGRFLDVQSRAFFKHGPKMGSKRPSGSILNRFWEGFGRTLARFGTVLGRIWEDFWLFEQIMARYA